MIQGRVRALLLLLLAMILGLTFRYYVLQIQQFERFSTLSDENRVHVRPLAPTRGLVFDRNGVILAENRPSYTLSIVRERVESLEHLLRDLQQLINLSAAEIDKFQELAKAYSRPYDGIPLRFQLSEQDVALLAVNQFRLPGIEIEVELLRHYPFAELFAHTVGYVGRINEREMAKIDAKRYENTHVIGKIGIEKQYEQELLGNVGSEYVETDARGNVLRVLERQDAAPGSDLYLHIDSRLQLLLYNLLNGQRASAVAIELDTGGVLAMVSVPSYDANLFVGGISHKSYTELLQDRNRPLYDRSLLGQYPPGSTVKPIFGLAGLVSGAVQEEWQIHDRGEFQLKGQERKYRDWKKGGHGVVDLRTAIEQSCDIYFYELGHRAGIDVLSEFGDKFGLGRRTGIDMPLEMPGIMPSRQWKRGARGIAWYPGDTINASIGQGFSLTTPLQLAQMTATLARRGQSVPPRMLAQIDGQKMTYEMEQVLDVETEQWDFIHQAMVDVVHNPRGTASRQGRDIRYRMAGKTGTAQVVGIAQDEEYNAEDLDVYQRDHALFIAFAPADAPRIAVAVIVENGEHGSSAAAPVARKLIDEWSKLYPLETAAPESADAPSPPETAVFTSESGDHAI